MPSLDSERPFDCWNNDLNVFAAGGVADGDGSRLAYLKGFASIGVPAFLDRGEEDWNPWTGEPSPSRSHDRMVVYVNAVADCFVGLSAGGKSLISWREPHGQP